MAYKIKYIERKKQKGWGVFNGDRLCNDWIYPDKADAENKLRLLETWNEAHHPTKS